MADKQELIPNDNQGDVIIYQAEDGKTKINVRFVDESVWLTQQQLVKLFDSSKANISEHIKNIYEEGELDEESTVRKFRTVQIEGDRLTFFSGDFPTTKDIGIAKNYLSEEELKILNGIVSGYFDFAEVQAMRHNPMHMSDYVEHLDRILSTTSEQVLVGAGKISHKQAMDKANLEYQRFLVQNLSPVEEAYLQTIKEVEKTAKKKSKEK
jgi:hypothetical protein